MFNTTINELKEQGATEEELKTFMLMCNSFEKLINHKKNKYNRLMTIGDYLMDRWEKAKFYNFGKGTNVHDNTIIMGNVEIGENTWVGPNVWLEGEEPYKLKIGSHCSISTGCQIYTHNSILWSITGGKHSKYEYANTTIEDNCYIGPNVIVQMGVTIGTGSIIGANSFVNKDIPPYSKAFGSPAKIIGSTREMIDEALKSI